jgi:ribose/xylose/arabinose/galactoside ABC-type transport system permease subunit
MTSGRRIRRAGPFLVAPLGLLALGAVFATTIHQFLTPANLLNVAGQASPLAIVALGQLAVLVAGAFDISVGSVAALSATVAALAMNVAGPGAIVVAPLVGAAAGFVNGVLVGRFAIQPIIATLGMLSFARGLALLISGSAPVALRDTSISSWLGYGNLAGIPVAFVAALVALLGVGLLMGRGKVGRRIHMVGSNRTAAGLVGVDVDGTIVWAFVISGVSAGIAGALFMGRAGSGLPTLGDGLELQAIAAAVIGGTSLAGGVGSAASVLVGALFIQLLANGLNLAGLSPFVREVVLGSVILVAGLLDFIVARLGSLGAGRLEERTS